MAARTATLWRLAQDWIDLDTGALLCAADKRIKDMRAVEGWLKMNLNMLQMSIQGLEMQRAALAAVKAMSQQAQQAGEGASDSASNPFASAAAMWPWNLMNNVPGSDEQPAASDTEAKGSSRGTRRKTPADK